ncbi:alpha/beta fold hydrolase [Pseudoduganella violaceinigra]|uniref:alpha/beta fold hydrolase n=1 Tax=Pseudoduganella violaceinigra TaxID=246602 RepID=UPI00040D89AB|nr:alpha/beta hydrolase [Pseudoduganella violaceinigra]
MIRRNFLKVGFAAVAVAAASGAARIAGAAHVTAQGTRLSPYDAALRSAAARDARAWRAARRFVSTSVGRVAVVERGRGPQAALFLHGLPLNSFQWRGAVARLAPHRRCIAPDFLGLGHSEPAPGASLDPEGQVAMLAELLDKLGAGPVDVVASDSGGAVAQLLLVLHPERVRSLLLTNCDTEIDSPPPAMLPVIELAKQGKFAQEWLAPWLADKDKARSADALGGLCYAHPAALADEVFETYLRPLVDNPQRLHGYIAALERNALYGILPALKASQAPVRVLWGMADGIFLPRGADYLEQAFGNSKGVRRIEGAKLFWPEERPELVAQEALALWRAMQPV